MAIITAILAPVGGGNTNASDRNDKTGTILTTAASSQIDLSAYQHFAFNANDDVHIRFGSGTVPTPTTSDFRIPGGTVVIYPVTKQNPSFKLYNPTTGTVTYWIQPLSGQL